MWQAFEVMLMVVGAGFAVGIFLATVITCVRIALGKWL